MRKSDPRNGERARKTTTSRRRRDKDVSNSSRLLATLEGEDGYVGRVRGANRGRWKVM